MISSSNCPRSEAKLPDRIFTNLRSKFGTFGSERKAFKGISYSSGQANVQNQIVHVPAPRNTTCLNKESLGLLCLAQVINNLEKQINCYQKYGLSSYLASCSTNLLSYKTYVATTVKAKHSWGVTTLLPLIFLTKNSPFGGIESEALNCKASIYDRNTKYSNANLNDPKGSPTIEEFDSSISLSSYNLTKILDDELDTGGIRSSLSKLNSEENAPIVSIPFKVTRDYISGDASEGFEDWSFLDQKRPYDSLVRENIFELLEDLQNFAGNAKATSLEGSVDIHTKVALEEHLFSSDINKTYANRLRLKQRIKQFYGLTNMKVENNTVIPYDTLLKLEERIDIQLFRLNWVSSIGHARQVLKHKHIGISERKDRLGAKNIEHTLQSVAASNLFLKEGDLLYQRNINIRSSYSHSGLDDPRGGASFNFHLFPWFNYICVDNESISEYNNMNNQTVTSPESFGSGLIHKPEESSQTYEVSSERKAFQGVFALSSDYGSISLSNELITSFQGSYNGSDSNAKRSEPKLSKLAIKKLSKYFETHYKHTYSIRTSQDFKLEYLRLPQSSINKNEWKAFLESSI